MATIGSEEAAATAAPRGTGNFDAHRSRLDELLKKQLFFVGGVFKSGTSWVQLLLDSHPQVSCSGECHIAGHLLPVLKAALEDHNRFLLKKYSDAFSELPAPFPTFDAADLDCLIATATLLLLAKHCGTKPALAIGEKTPDSLVFFEGLGSLFPSAKFIHVVRDPRDAAVSGWFHVMRVIPAETRRHFATILDYVRYFADRWPVFVREALEFGARNPTRYAEVTYEKLNAEPEAALSGLLRFLGVDAGSGAVRHCIAAASFDRLSGGRALGQENRASLFRKGVTGDWKNHLDEATNRHVIEKAGPLMRRFGFI